MHLRFPRCPPLVVRHISHRHREQLPLYATRQHSTLQYYECTCEARRASRWSCDSSHSDSVSSLPFQSGGAWWNRKGVPSFQGAWEGTFGSAFRDAGGGVFGVTGGGGWVGGRVDGRVGGFVGGAWEGAFEGFVGGCVGGCNWGCVRECIQWCMGGCIWGCV